MTFKPRVCVDFDNTIYTGAGIFPGCIEKLTEFRLTHTVSIFSARLTDAERRQMKELLDQYGVPYDEILPQKPDAVMYIDDKGRQFKGDWSEISL